MQPTKRTFSYFNLEDMHTCITAVTACKVRCDGLAREFTIARRRAVGALSTKSKKLEAGLTRVQIIADEKNKIVQLVAFFDEQFEHADSMAFIIKATDAFERYDGKQMGLRAKFGIKIPDAKFALPTSAASRGLGGKQEDFAKGFLCLEMPDYPTENDDIVIGFDEAQGALQFVPSKQTKTDLISQSEKPLWQHYHLRCQILHPREQLDF